jgi:2-dehydropantoate 2-reductase
MRFLVLGAGAIGGYFGGRLAESGADVTFLVRPGVARSSNATVSASRARSETCRGRYRTALADSVAPDYDVVLLTCKAYDLQPSIEAIAPAVGPQTAIIPLLNGLAHFAVLDAHFGASRVMGGTCMIDSTLGRDGVVHHGGTLQRLVFGERDGRRSPRAEAVAAVLAGTTVDWSLSDDIEQVLWDKLVFLAALASLTCLFRANVREIISAPGGREAMLRALAANAEIAAREGHPPSTSGLDFARTRLTDPAGRGAPLCCATSRAADASRPITSSVGCSTVHGGTVWTTRCSRSRSPISRLSKRAERPTACQAASEVCDAS